MQHCNACMSRDLLWCAEAPQQAQQEAKKSRFSLNFLRGSLLSPKGVAASSKSNNGSIFSSIERKASIAAAPPQPAADSPSRAESINDSATSAQHWSPLGHGASAFSGSQAAPDDGVEEATSRPSEEEFSTLAGQRSPLRALSSNSPTRLRPAYSDSLGGALSRKSRPSSLNAPIAPADQDRINSLAGNDFADSSALTMVLSAAASAQHTPLPANALVAYSSDEDDWHNAVDATERKPLSASMQPAGQLDCAWYSALVICHMHNLCAV